MSLASPSLVKMCTACAVMIAFWLSGTGNARAGCGDHGYVVERANGEVMVVTPSHPACPCQGPQCKSSKPPLTPISQVEGSTFAENAWSGNAVLVLAGPCLLATAPSPEDKSLAGYCAEILQPPRLS
ncbi:MAG: hypothetical protein ACKOS8_15870 [Gemmataceae bacterium]